MTESHEVLPPRHPRDIVVAVFQPASHGLSAREHPAATAAIDFDAGRARL